MWHRNTVPTESGLGHIGVENFVGCRDESEFSVPLLRLRNGSSETEMVGFILKTVLTEWRANWVSAHVRSGGFVAGQAILPATRNATANYFTFCVAAMTTQLEISKNMEKCCWDLILRDSQRVELVVVLARQCTITWVLPLVTLKAKKWRIREGRGMFVFALSANSWKHRSFWRNIQWVLNQLASQNFSSHLLTFPWFVLHDLFCPCPRLPGFQAVKILFCSARIFPCFSKWSIYFWKKHLSAIPSSFPQWSLIVAITLTANVINPFVMSLWSMYRQTM